MCVQACVCVCVCMCCLTASWALYLAMEKSGEVRQGLSDLKGFLGW